MTTMFSIKMQEATTELLIALESDGSQMHESFRKALELAKEAEDNAYQHSIGEKIAAANLVNTINTVKQVTIYG